MPIKFDARGREIPDPKPMELVPGAYMPESLQSMMQRMIRDYVSAHAVEQGEESFEEANDFDCDDSEFDDPLTKYEEMGDEFGTAESEDGAAPSGNSRQADAARLRSGSAEPSDGDGGPEESSVDNEPVRAEADSLRPASGKTAVPAGSGRNAVRRR